jgi:peptidoglycan/xylan/chitin deacetylase (PgdA/CDA1 family)
MSDWLAPLRAAVAAGNATFFFRDDDAGWGEDRLHRLLDVFEDAGAPIDLAVIPRATTPALAAALDRRRRAAPQLVRVHQHGLAHKNHEQTGRKCEFGVSRSYEQQLEDVVNGQRILRELFETEPDSIFTPPWNRCTAATARAVHAAGIDVLSRESRAEPLGETGVRELPVSVDWMRERDGVRVTPDEIGSAIADAVAERAPVGVMLHHAVMDGADRALVAELLDLLQSSPAVRLATMRQLARTEVPA